MPERLWQWPPLWAVAGLFACLAVAVPMSMARTDGHLVYAVDDAYIHMAIAKNLARHAVWGCTPFHFSSSSSSLLWTVVLGAGYLVSGVHDLVPLVLNVVAAALTLVVADHYLARFGAPRLLRVSVLLGLVIACPLPGLVLLGMEHNVHLLLTIWFAGAAVEALADPPADSLARRRQTMLVCGLAACLAGSRYEGFFVVGLICLAFLVRGDWRRGLLIGIVAALPTAIFGALSLANGALFFPNSLMLKAGGASASVLDVLLKPVGHGDLAPFQRNRGLLMLVVLGLLLTVVRWRGARQVWRPQVLIPLGLSLTILLQDHFAFSSTFWVYRYDAYLMGFGVFAVGVGLAGPWSSIRTPWARVPGLVPALGVAILVAMVADPKEGVLPADEIAGMTNTYLEHYEAARFVKRYYPQEAVVVNDLGAVSYFTDARIVDLVGLGDMEPLRIRRQTGDYTGADVQVWTAKYAPAIAILQLDWSFVAPRIPRGWIKAAEVEVPPAGQRIGFFAVDQSAASRLRRNVERYYGPLCAGLGYRLRLF